MPDVIVGIGGGSAMDMAKAIAVLAHNRNPAITYRGFNKMTKPVLPIILLPTTAGTGSEITPNASFVDSVQKKKMGIHLVWLTLLISFATDILLEFTYPDYIASQAGSMSTSINIAFSGVCSVICGVIVAIPLMVTGSGMDDSSLIG